MWDFDIHGDLYFEKAVNGFLADLFAKWKVSYNLFLFVTISYYVIYNKFIESHKKRNSSNDLCE